MFSTSFSLISRYVAPVTSNYYEGTGYSKVLLKKRNPALVISMALRFRSENGLILYLGSEVNHLPLSESLLCICQSLKAFLPSHRRTITSP